MSDKNRESNRDDVAHRLNKHLYVYISENTVKAGEHSVIHRGDKSKNNHKKATDRLTKIILCESMYKHHKCTYYRKEIVDCICVKRELESLELIALLSAGINSYFILCSVIPCNRINQCEIEERCKKREQKQNYKLLCRPAFRITEHRSDCGIYEKRKDCYTNLIYEKLNYIVEIIFKKLHTHPSLILYRIFYHNKIKKQVYRKNVYSLSTNNK